MKRSSITNGLVQPLASTFGCPPRRNGNAPLAAELRANSSLGAMLRRIHCLIMQNDGKLARSRLPGTRRMDSVFMTSVKTYTNGAVIGMKRITTQSRQNEIQVDLNQALAAPLAEAPGGTTSKWRVALRVPAFLRSSNMRTTAFGSRAVSRTLIHSLWFVVKSFTDTSKHCKVLPAS